MECFASKECKVRINDLDSGNMFKEKPFMFAVND